VSRVESRNSRIINDLSSRHNEISEENAQAKINTSNIHVLFSIMNHTYIEIRDCSIISKNKDLV